MAKPWERKSNRIRPKRKVKPHILIVCEGEKTEPLYFESFKIKSVDISIIGTGFNTISLVEYAISLEQAAENSDEPYDQVWCVFDKDSFSKNNFNNAINKAKSNKINVAYSNQAFELWYLLHFDYYDVAINRTDYKRMLSSKLGKKYEKNMPNIYSLLKDKQHNAIKNAKNLINKYKPHIPANDNPCTTVYELVTELNNYI